jgi:hypothetical protein
VPLAAADLWVKATEPTPAWAYHERSLAWLALSTALFFGMFVVARIPSALVPAAAGVLAGGLLGNSLSAAWNGMLVPNPLVVGGSEALFAFNLADVWALLGIALLVFGIAVWLIGNRERIPALAEVASSRGRAFRRLFDEPVPPDSTNL